HHPGAVPRPPWRRFREALLRLVVRRGGRPAGAGQPLPADLPQGPARTGREPRPDRPEGAGGGRFQVRGAARDRPERPGEMTDLILAVLHHIAVFGFVAVLAMEMATL